MFTYVFVLCVGIYAGMYVSEIRIRDHWIQESIKHMVFNSGQSGLQKKNPNCHKYATLRSVFLCFHGQKKNNFFLKNIVVSALKRYKPEKSL